MGGVTDLLNAATITSSSIGNGGRRKGQNFLLVARELCAYATTWKSRAGTVPEQSLKSCEGERAISLERHFSR